MILLPTISLNKKKASGFTIIELLVVIVVIGILAAIVFVAYSTVSQRATATVLQSDLSSATKQIKAFQAEKGTFPTANNCTNTGASEICLKASNGNTLTYTPNDTSNPTSYSLVATKGSTSYQSSSTSSSSGDAIPELVTNGLVLNLDAGNSASYPGTGTTWTDLSGSGNNGTLGNSPTFSTLYGGNLLFNGTNNYGRATSLSLSSFANGFTWGGWVTHNNYSASWGWICGGSNLSNGQPYPWFQIGKISASGGIRFETGSFFSNTALDAPSVNVADGNWHYVIGVVNLATGTKSIYFDGYLASSTNITVNNTSLDYGTLTFGVQMRTNTSYTQYWPGRIANIQAYNRALSTSEITQNFNSLRSRFGT